jgi:hypothetical protein
LKVGDVVGVYCGNRTKAGRRGVLWGTSFQIERLRLLGALAAYIWKGCTGKAYLADLKTERPRPNLCTS